MREYPHLVDVNKMPKVSKKSDRSFRKLAEFNGILQVCLMFNHRVELIASFFF